MKKEEFVVEIKEEGLSDEKMMYSADARKKESEIPSSIYFFSATKLDNRYLLEEDRPGRRESIFGIADDQREADERIYAKALGRAKEFTDFYGKLGKVEFIDKTQHAKSIESKI